MKRIPPIAWFAALIVIVYGDIVFAGRGLFLQDVTTYHYPMKSAVRSVISRGAFPFWNRYWSGGQPLAANPAYEVFYPPQWLIFLPSFHFGLQLHILLHFVIAAAGMYVLARSLGCGAIAATFAGITFAFCGPYLSLSAKLPILFSYSWMPWTLFFGRRFLLGRDARSFAAAAAVLGAQVIIFEPTVLMQTVALLGGYAIMRNVGTAFRPSQDGLKPVPTLRRIAIDVGWVGAIGLAAVALTSVQLIPAVDFARDTVRSQPFPFEFVSNWSTPPARVLEMIAPKYFDRVLNESGRPLMTGMYAYRIEAFLPSLYLGIAVFVLGAAGVLARMRGAWLMLGSTLLFMIIAFGEHTPVLRLLYDVGVFRAVRFPEKFMLAPAVILIVWAALVFERLSAGDKRVARSVSLAAVAALGIALIAVLSQSHVEPRWYLGEVMARIAVMWCALVYARRDRRWAAAFVAIAAIDVCSATRALVPRMPRSYFDPAPLAAQLPSTGRIYSEASWDWFDQKPISSIYFAGKTVDQFWWTIRNGAFPNVPVYWGHELALEDDVDRTSLLTTDAFREALKRVRLRGGDEAPLLAMANVHALLRFRPPEQQPWVAPVEVVATAKAPRYFFARKLHQIADPFDVLADLNAESTYVPFPAFTPATGRISNVSETDNVIRLRAQNDGRGVLVLSVTGHRYWSAHVDGQTAQIHSANIAYQALVLEPGAHTVELRYRNPLIAIGAVISLVSIAALSIAAVRARASQSPATAG